MPKEIERIARLLEKTFEKQPWYGSSVMEILKNIEPKIVDQKIGQTDSINELVMHMISWRLFATRRLLGDDEFQVTDEINFPKPGAWDETLIKLQSSQAALVVAATNFPEEKLGELCASKEMKYTYYTLLHGIIQHDVYHLGQIALLKKVFEN
jgi:uncharacterized damage-inducible protein DinB